MPAEVLDENKTATAAAKRGPSQSPNPLNEDGLSECFRVVRTNMYVSLAPCHITNPINGIKCQHLDPLIMKYFNKARGVVLSYSNLAIQENESSKDADGNVVAKVTDASPFSFMWISVDFLLWYPQIGDILEGNVYMQTASHIGLLLHDTFNASIKYRNIPQDWQFVPSQADEFAENEGEANNGKFRSFGSWYDGNNNKIEGKLRFTVKSLFTSGKMLAMEGTLVSPESEIDAQPVSTDSLPVADTPVSESKHITFADDEPAADSSELPQDVASAIPKYDQNASSSSSEEDSDSD